MGTVVTLGEAMYTVAATSVEPLRTASTAALSWSGCEATVAIGVRRLGHEAHWISRLGDDGPGAHIRSRLLGEGVYVHAECGAEPTGLMLKERPWAGERRVTYHRAGSAASALGSADLPPGVIEAADVFHTSGITAAIGEGPADTVRAAFERAAVGGTLVSFDVNHRSRLWTSDAARAAILPLLPRIDLLFASVDEAALLLRSDDTAPERLLAGLAEAGPTTVVVTDGARGAWWRGADGNTLHEPARTAVEVDPFGAGDAFVAGFLAATLDGEPVGDRARRAAHVASIAVASTGDWEGLPTSSDLGSDRGGPDNASPGSIRR